MNNIFASIFFCSIILLLRAEETTDSTINLVGPTDNTFEKLKANNSKIESQKEASPKPTQSKSLETTQLQNTNKAAVVVQEPHTKITQETPASLMQNTTKQVSTDQPLNRAANTELEKKSDKETDQQSPNKISSAASNETKGKILSTQQSTLADKAEQPEQEQQATKQPQALSPDNIDNTQQSEEAKAQESETSTPKSSLESSAPTVAPTTSLAKTINKAAQAEPEVESENDTLTPEQRNNQLIPFVFDRTPLIDIINLIAKKRRINIILPQRAADAEIINKQTVTYHPTGKKEITLKEAWDTLGEFLRISGFSIFAKKDTLYAIVPVGPTTNEPCPPSGISREPLPLFVETPPDNLPLNVNRIRYINYLRNLRVPTPEDKDNPLIQVFQDMLSRDAIIIFEPKSNGFIIADNANRIAAMMKIILELDATGFREVIEVIRLYNVPASQVAAIFETARKATGGQDKMSPFLRADPKADSISYFASDTKVIPYDNNNMLIVMGRETAVSRIRDFVQNSIDLPEMSGQSILHTYDLQYLDAQAFEMPLQEILSTQVAESAQGAQASIGETERFFQGVIVKAEKIDIVEKLTPEKGGTQEVQLSDVEGRSALESPGIQGDIHTGGNRLIIAAYNEDWGHIKDFIAQLDRPQPQVILEVLIVDLTNSEIRLVAGDVRSRTADAFSPVNGAEFLSTNIGPVNTILGQSPGALTESATIARDLLNVVGLNNPGNVPLASQLTQGSLIISFNDPATPGIFAVLQILQTYTNAKILSHPYMVTTNNQKATITNQTVKRDRGDAVPSPSGNVTIQIENIPATLQVQMIPRLSSMERLSLQIAVDINDFIGSTLDRNTRRVNTNANLQSGQILVIGGLTQVTSTDIVAGTPIISSIPLIGSFFRRTQKQFTKTNIAIFICPTIVHPKLRGGMNTYTIDKVRKGRRDIANETIFGETKDPIIRMFFGQQANSDKLVKSYLRQSINAPSLNAIKTTRERRRELRRPTKPSIIESNRSIEATGGALPTKQKNITELPA